ncbi:MAG TPA: hypothetical protein VLC09_07880 [Polyangiaceae bacterium]|nr:hypothetical protein [Polyangiaceae bacterium]
MSYRQLRAALPLVLGLLSACTPAETPPPSPPPEPPPAPPEHVPPPEAETTSKTATPEDLGIQILSKVGFKTPESVLYDPAQDVYFVSNINGTPLEVDGNGFIAKVTPTGEVTLDFIAGGKNGVKLNAPKGMAISAGLLYVADIDTVRTFDSTTGAPKGDIPIAGASFLNDIAEGLDGSLYVSDSALDKSFASTGKDAIYKLVKGKPKKLVANKKLAGPNGLLAAEGGVWVVTFGSGELYFVDDKGKQDRVQKLPKGSNDGIVQTKSGSLLVSSWEGAAVFAGDPGGEFVELMTGLTSPADIGYDSKRNRLLVPLFQKDEVVFQDLSKLGAASAKK